MEHKRYQHPRICICGTCGGAGKQPKYHQHDLLNMNATLITCTTCLGSGRVSVSREIITRVNPYKPTKNEQETPHS